MRRDGEVTNEFVVLCGHAWKDFGLPIGWKGRRLGDLRPQGAQWRWRIGLPFQIAQDSVRALILASNKEYLTRTFAGALGQAGTREWPALRHLVLDITSLGTLLGACAGISRPPPINISG